MRLAVLFFHGTQKWFNCLLESDSNTGMYSSMWQVEWDESMASGRHERVSLWEIEPFNSVATPLPPTSLGQYPSQKRRLARPTLGTIPFSAIHRTFFIVISFKVMGIALEMLQLHLCFLWQTGHYMKSAELCSVMFQSHFIPPS